MIQSRPVLLLVEGVRVSGDPVPGTTPGPADGFTYDVALQEAGGVTARLTGVSSAAAGRYDGIDVLPARVGSVHLGWVSENQVTAWIEPRLVFEECDE